ncbi:ABC transporter for cysteine ATP-binding protein [Psychromonas ingrahamii 37]|uniref:Glutathione/L-cysteine transport system ATP-binding/permease protein CydC n=1 Tax=Psychromonas ingrahamii (strain DSM 17664 / CCUG 51855 / 37) TaxID=357804 RepID=A1T072_PSYIN|nr:cysteine/glutathione ABC transporter ATP-binding protein/permease CydC [Psychromonas ingrahamii]ABM05137.1 ABC transporter for cysteine ATP-binding protein [Psychromonas ingrahamii 37]
MRTLLPFLKLFKHQWLMMLIGLFLSITTLFAGIGLLSLSGWFLSASAVAGLTLVATQAFNYFTPAGGVRFLSIMRTASRYGERLATHEATFKLLTRLRVWAWRKVLPLSARNMQKLRQGELLNRLVADIDTLDHLYLRLITPMISALLMIVGLYLFVAWIDVQLALILCGSLLLIWLILPWIFYFLGRKPGIKQLESKRVLRVQILEFVQGLAEISLFGADQRFREKLRLSEENLLDSQRAMVNVTGLSQAALILCHGIVVVLILYIAASGIGEHQPPGPMLAMVTFMVLACIEMLMPIAGAFQHLSSCVNAGKRVNELVEQTPDIVFNNQNQTVVKKGALQLKDIVFSYEKGGVEILKGINLSIKVGEKVALLGPTGCGKSSLLSLITREWAPNSGRLLLDGIAVDQYSQQALTGGLSLVSQRIYLFSGTLRDNLTLAQPNLSEFTTYAEQKAAEESNDKHLIVVLKKVGLSALIEGDNSLDAWIGEGGRQLSGGEQRRIGVARVLLRDAPLLLLDEPTEGLDKRTEREILSLLFEFAKHKTVLMISHRLTAMTKMDEIHLMEDGLLRVSGSHSDLLAQDDYYASLHQQLH